MPTLTIKNIPEDLYAQLKQYAALNRRSVNSEVILCIERAIRSRRIQPEAYLARARRLRAKTKHYPISDDEFNAMKVAGRP
ncbi:MAG: Arc family DNA-binding protein [Gammaproteobacteria bacterium]|nr:MAG: Arc family DNA-binding protein [Gammaproteobacteria bacterium]